MSMMGIIAGLSLAALTGGMRMSMKGVIAGLLLVAVAAAPALAHEHDADEGAAVQTDGSAAPTEAGEEQETVVCPSCGKQVVIGRHGQAGRTAICPHCGKEICPAEEAEKPLCFGADAGFFSKYVSRGVTLSADPVFQPNVWLSYKALNVSVWGNMDLTDINGNEGEFNELDFTAGYSWDWDGLSLSAGGIYYVFPNTGSDDTAEIYAAVGYDTILQPTLTVFYDFLEADGFYCALGIGHSFDIPLPTEAVTAGLDLSAQAGWGSKGFNEFNSGSYHNAFTDAVFTASLPVGLFDSFTLTPSVSYSTALDHTIRSKNSDNDNVVFGLVVSASL